MTKQTVRIIAGSTCGILAHDVAKKLRVQLLPSEMQYFANTEIRPVIKQSVRHKDVFVIQSPGNGQGVRSVNDSIMETLLLLRTLRRSDAGNVTLILTSFPYARQDKKDNPRGAISARDIADMLEGSGLHRIVTFDLHSAQIQGFFNVPCDNLYTAHLIKKYFDTYVFKKDFQKKYVLIAPDEGALKRMREYAGMFGLPLFVLSKERDYRKKNEVERTTLIGDTDQLQDKTAIVIDDMIDTFGTIDTASALIQKAGAKDLIVASTHGILSGPALARIQKNDFVKMVLVSDSLDQTHNTHVCTKIKVFSIANMIAETIRRLSRGESLSEMFTVADN